MGARTAYWREHKRRQRAAVKRLAAEPLAKVISCWSGPVGELARRAGVSHRHLRRVRARQVRGVSPWFADQVCIAVGMHPVQLWPRAWVSVSEEPRA